MLFFWRRKKSITQKTRIVILGGGFAGVSTAMRLEKRLARDPNVEVTLVSKENFLLFTPMLHEVVTGELNPAHIVNPIRKLLRRVKFFLGDVECIDLTGKRVVVSHGSSHHHHELLYDHLILALGATTNYFNIPGLEGRAFTMKTLDDAFHLRNHIIQNLEEADVETHPEHRNALLTVVVAGAGFAGVETIGGLNDFVRESLRFYPSLKEEMVRFVLVDAGPRVLPELSEKLGNYTRAKLEKRKIEVMLNTSVVAVNEHAVKLSDGTTIQSNTLIWTAGNAPHPLLATLPCEKARGRPIGNEFFEVPEWPGVWTVGDGAMIADPRTGKPYPPTAQHAIRQGKVLAYNLEAKLRDGEMKPFVFDMLGQLAAIGKRSGVANILGLNFSGFFAWILWRTIYLMKLPRLEKKLRVAIDWTMDLFFSKDLVQFARRERRTAPSPGASRPDEDREHEGNGVPFPTAMSEIRIEQRDENRDEEWAHGVSTR